MQIMKTNLKHMFKNFTVAVTTIFTFVVCASKASAAGVAASASTHNLYVDNKQVSPTAYLIDGSNYFKLRDIGKLVDFGVSYDSAKKAVSINTSESYIPESGESGSITNSAHSGATANVTNQTIFVDGKQVSPTAYIIDGNNFFKLRDLGDLVGFGVTYTAETKRVDISTNTLHKGNASEPITTWDTTMWQFHDAMISCSWDADKYRNVIKEYGPKITGKQEASIDEVINALENQCH